MRSKSPMNSRGSSFEKPQGSEAPPVPANHGLGFDNRDRVQNRGEQSVQPGEDQAIDVPEPHPRLGLAAKDDQLLTQDQVFGLESRP
jgi:hypothetical protein